MSWDFAMSTAQGNKFPLIHRDIESTAEITAGTMLSRLSMNGQTERVSNAFALRYLVN